MEELAFMELLLVIIRDCRGMLGLHDVFKPFQAVPGTKGSFRNIWRRIVARCIGSENPISWSLPVGPIRRQKLPGSSDGWEPSLPREISPTLLKAMSA